MCEQLSLIIRLNIKIQVCIKQSIYILTTKAQIIIKTMFLYTNQRFLLIFTHKSLVKSTHKQTYILKVQDYVKKIAWI